MFKKNFAQSLTIIERIDRKSKPKVYSCQKIYHFLHKLLYEYLILHFHVGRCILKFDILIALSPKLYGQMGYLVSE